MSRCYRQTLINNSLNNNSFNFLEVHKLLTNKISHFGNLICFYYGYYRQREVFRNFMQKHNKTEEEIKELVENYSTLIFRISYCILCNSHDAEDAVQ